MNIRFSGCPKNTRCPEPVSRARVTPGSSSPTSIDPLRWKKALLDKGCHRDYPHGIASNEVEWLCWVVDLRLPGVVGGYSLCSLKGKTCVFLMKQHRVQYLPKRSASTVPTMSPAPKGMYLNSGMHTFHSDMPDSFVVNHDFLHKKMQQMESVKLEVNASRCLLTQMKGLLESPGGNGQPRRRAGQRFSKEL